MRPSRSGSGGSLGFGIVVLAFGVVLLLHNLGVADFRDVVRAAALSMRNLWPLLLVFWGAQLIWKGLRARGRRPSADPSAASDVRS